MFKKKFIVSLNPSARNFLEQLTKKGNLPEYQMNHARILIKANINQKGGGWTDDQISESLDIDCVTIQSVRQRYVEQGLESALNHRPKMIKNGEKESYLIPIESSETLAERGNWRLELFEDKVIEIEYVEDPDE